MADFSESSNKFKYISNMKRVYIPRWCYWQQKKYSIMRNEQHSNQLKLHMYHQCLLIETEILKTMRHFCVMLNERKTECECSKFLLLNLQKLTHNPTNPPHIYFVYLYISLTKTKIIERTHQHFLQNDNFHTFLIIWIFVNVHNVVPFVFSIHILPLHVNTKYKTTKTDI